MADEEREEPPRRKLPAWVWPAALAAAGLLGLGNGAWSYITEPSLFWLRNKLLSVVTLGIQAQKDEVYLHAARGPHEHTATTILMMLLLGLGLGAGIWFASHMELLRWARAQAYGIEQKPSAVARFLGDPRVNPKRSYRRLQIIMSISALIVTYQVGVFLARSLKGQYCTAAIAYYSQLRAVVAPHVPPQRLLEYDAQFATVRSRSDYLTLMTELDAQARKHTDKLPSFYVW